MPELFVKFKTLYSGLAARAYSVIILFALICTLAVKFYHSCRTDLVEEYIIWVLSDVCLLVGLEILLVYCCNRWRRKSVFRAATIVSAVVCFWSVVNAAWIIRNGAQILPTVFLPLLRDPLNSLLMVGVNVIKMPFASFVLLGPSALAILFFISVLVRPRFLNRSSAEMRRRVIFSFVLVITLLFIRILFSFDLVGRISSEELAYNSQIRAVTSIIFSIYRHNNDSDELSEPQRQIPTFDKVGSVPILPDSERYNIVIVVLEGIQYRYTSLWSKGSRQTPFLSELASQGVEFSNTRCTVTHTTKVLFSLFTGRYPSISQDIAEAVPAVSPYCSLVTILEKSGYRSAFFQSAKGDFECRPGLVYNLGFDNFYSRENLAEPDEYVGYLGSDEFVMLPAVRSWAQSENSPFVLMVLCSVSHDPYVVPNWYGEPKEEPEGRYRQAVKYTDDFLRSLYQELVKSGVSDKTIFCVVGDHGEAFGEHGQMGHERIGFEEVLRVPFLIVAEGLVSSGRQVTEPVSSVDMTPTLLGLLGLEAEGMGLNGVDVLAKENKPQPLKGRGEGRRLYFSGWLEESPLGFVRGWDKFIYNPLGREVRLYNLRSDPFEKMRIKLEEQAGEQIAEEIFDWRRETVFEIQQKQGRKVLFQNWLVEWKERISSAEYLAR